MTNSGVKEIVDEMWDTIKYMPKLGKSRPSFYDAAAYLVRKFPDKLVKGFSFEFGETPCDAQDHAIADTDDEAVI